MSLFDLVDRTTVDKHAQDLPKIVAIVQFGISTLLHLQEKVGKGLLNHIFLVFGFARHGF
jgi:hypothetical protein